MTDDDSSNDRFDAMLDAYGWLRDEINQSNQLQHRIVLGLATFVGLVFGLEFSGTLSEFASATPTTFRLVVGAILPIVVVAPGIWLVEQSRVMMAGNYLQLLEHKIHDETDHAPVAWENWLRWDGGEVTVTGRLDAQAIYSRGYFLGYLGFFAIVGVLTLGLFATRVVWTGGGTALGALSRNPLAATYLLLWSAFLAGTLYYASQVVRHSGHAIEVDTLDAFERRTFERRVFLEDAFEAAGDRVDELGLDGDDYGEQFEQLVALAERHRNQQGT